MNWNQRGSSRKLDVALDEFRTVNELDLKQDQIRYIGKHLGENRLIIFTRNKKQMKVQISNFNPEISELNCLTEISIELELGQHVQVIKLNKFYYLVKEMEMNWIIQADRDRLDIVKKVYKSASGEIIPIEDNYFAIQESSQNIYIYSNSTFKQIKCIRLASEMRLQSYQKQTKQLILVSQGIVYGIHLFNDQKVNILYSHQMVSRIIIPSSRYLVKLYQSIQSSHISLLDYTLETPIEAVKELEEVAQIWQVYFFKDKNSNQEYLILTLKNWLQKNECLIFKIHDNQLIDGSTYHFDDKPCSLIQCMNLNKDSIYLFIFQQSQNNSNTLLINKLMQR